jgi:hypothetical protein
LQALFRIKPQFLPCRDAGFWQHFAQHESARPTRDAHRAARIGARLLERLQEVAAFPFANPNVVVSSLKRLPVSMAKTNTSAFRIRTSLGSDEDFTVQTSVLMLVVQNCCAINLNLAPGILGPLPCGGCGV